MSAALTAAVCGRSNNVTGPSSGGDAASAISITISPTPILTQAQWGAAGPVRYQIDGIASLRDTRGTGGRITQLLITLVTPSGHVVTRPVEVDLTIPAGGTVVQSIAREIDLPRDRVPTRLRVSATVQGPTGGAAPAPTVDVPLAVTIAGEGGAFPDVTFSGAGDIAVCNSTATEGTARVLDGLRGTVFTLGDNTYPTGTASSFSQCYEPAWGRHRSRTRPAPGNHDWEVSGGAPYFSYFGAAAGPPGLGYYSHTVGTWHVLSLNSNIPADPGSPQYEWARNDLAANNTACSLAIWHHPLFSSGPNGNHSHMREMWRLLHNAGVDLILVGHDHSYERFAPQDADGRFDPQGVRSIVVGTGGAALRPFVSIQPNSEVRNNQVYGVLRLGLRPRGYEWEFMPISGQSFSDLGSALCR